MAADVILTWDANTEINLIGYRVYQKVGDADYKLAGSVLATAAPPTHTIQNIDTSKANQFYVTAYNAGLMESGPSNVVTVVAAPGAPAGLKWSVVIKLVAD